MRRKIEAKQAAPPQPSTERGSVLWSTRLFSDGSEACGAHIWELAVALRPCCYVGQGIEDQMSEWTDEEISQCLALW